MKRISFWGVIIGSIVAYIAAGLREFLLMAYEYLPHDDYPMTEEQVSQVISYRLTDTTLFSVWMVWGAFCAFMGGYIAARIAGRGEVLNGALASFFVVGSGVYTLLFARLYLPAWQHASELAAGVALSALGGYIRLRGRTARAASEAG